MGPEFTADLDSSADVSIKKRKNEFEEKMLLNLHKKKWTDSLTLRHFDSHSKTNEQTIQEMLNLAVKYNKAVQEEDKLPPEKLAITLCTPSR
ncbi:hypothetical protein K1719_038688 [Acacia pycnantha]|nr:hypothetical protein K1719_038688 [Acacia pycnantha]